MAASTTNTFRAQNIAPPSTVALVKPASTKTPKQVVIARTKPGRVPSPNVKPYKPPTAKEAKAIVAGPQQTKGSKQPKPPAVAKQSKGNIANLGAYAHPAKPSKSATGQQGQPFATTKIAPPPSDVVRAMPADGSGFGPGPSPVFNPGTTGKRKRQLV